MRAVLLSQAPLISRMYRGKVAVRDIQRFGPDPKHKPADTDGEDTQCQTHLPVGEQL